MAITAYKSAPGRTQHAFGAKAGAPEKKAESGMTLKERTKAFMFHPLTTYGSWFAAHWYGYENKVPEISEALPSVGAIGLAAVSHFAKDWNNKYFKYGARMALGVMAAYFAREALGEFSDGDYLNTATYGWFAFQTGRDLVDSFRRP